MFCYESQSLACYKSIEEVYWVEDGEGARAKCLSFRACTRRILASSMLMG